MKLFVVLALLALVQVQCLTFSTNSNSTIAVNRRHITAMFGPQQYSVVGRVQVAAPSELCARPEDAVYTTDVRIIFILRGNCTFYEKAQNAMALGASGVVIANAHTIGTDEPFLLGYPPGLSPSAVTIPVVSVSKSTFDAVLKANTDNGGTVSVSLNSRPDAPPNHGGGDDDRRPPHDRSSTGVSSSSGHHGSSSSSSSASSTGSNQPSHDDGKPRRPQQQHASTSWVIAVGVIAVVASSCLCGFCIGRHCGAGRTCRRNAARAPAVSQSAVPVAPVTVHQGQSYTQVDIENAPAGYYGQEMMPIESLPTPSAPAYHPSAPSSAEMRYA